MAWGVALLVLSKSWLKNLVQPEKFGIHAGLTTVAVEGVHGVKLLKRKLARVTAVDGWLRFDWVEGIVVEEQRGLLWDESLLSGSKRQNVFKHIYRKK